MRARLEFVLFCGMGLANLDAHGAVLELMPGEQMRNIGAYMAYRLGDGLPLDDVADVAQLPESAFAPLPDGRLNFGFTTRTIWVTFEVENAGAVPGRWRLSTNALYAVELGIWRQREGELIPLLTNSRNHTFYERPIPDRLLAATLELGPGERSRIFIGLRRTGATSMTVTIDSDQSFATRRFRANVANAAVYSAIGFAALFALLQFAVLRDRAHLVYLWYVASVTLYLVQTDGLAFQYLWPSFGRWNEVAALPFGLTNGIASAQFARTFLGTGSLLPRLDRMLFSMMLISAAVAVAGLLLLEPFFKQTAIWISISITLLCLVAGVAAYRRGRKSVRFYLVAWGGVALATIAWGVINGAHSDFDFDVGQYVTKGGLLFDMLMFLLAIADQARETRAERDRQLRAELDHERRQQRLDERLQAAEQARLEALVLARQRTVQLAAATHDIRQPLTSVKLTLASLANDARLGSAVLGPIADAVARLDELVREALADGNPPTNARVADRSSYPVQLVLDNLELMFREDAADKGLEFRCRRSSVVAAGESMAVMRIAGALLAALIAERDAGSLLVACRCRAGTPRLMIYVSRPEGAVDEGSRRARGRRGAPLLPAGAATSSMASAAVSAAVALSVELCHELTVAAASARTTIWMLDLKPAPKQAPALAGGAR